ncbi:hypothetical protein ABZ470_26705 [Streptosporangium sp. NPDC020072]|uniref:hypothetical protein n=1 Tax=Streptosporangium sp. NPDC020072 TaxID=3154788 RepID=UPI003412BC46
MAAKLAAWADWTTMTTRPTEQRIADDLDLALSTVKRWIRWLRERGFLGVVEEGTTVRFRRGTRCGLDDDGMGNRAAVWVLCIPLELDEHAPDTDKTTSEPPSLTLPKRVNEGPTHTREGRSSSRRQGKRISTTGEPTATPGTRKHALQVAQKLYDASSTLQRLTPWYIRYLIKTFVAAEWTASDVLHALDHKPDGTAWTYTWTSRDQIRNVPGWVRFRLSAWLDEHGRPLPGKLQRLKLAAEQLRAEQRAARAQSEKRNAQRAGGTGAAYVDRARKAREMLAQASPAAARVMREKGSAQPRRVVERSRWERIDQAAQAAVSAQPMLVEESAPVQEVDAELMRRRLSRARAVERARRERQRPPDRQNDKSDLFRKGGVEGDGACADTALRESDRR